MIMGTDIHMAAEVRRNGKWKLVTKKVFPNMWYDPTSPYFSKKPKFVNCPYDGRNYDLFAILADVRNERGFGGSLTAERFNPISEPKGYPEDMCEELKSDISEGDYEEDWDDEVGEYRRPHLSNDHSGSWLTLKELLDYDWNQLHSSVGFLSQEEYAKSIYKGEHPTSWCGWVGGVEVVHVTEKEMIDIIEGRYPVKPGEHYYVQCKFPPLTYAEKAGTFYSEVIPVLKTLVPVGGTTKDVRIVFDFDS